MSRVTNLRTHIGTVLITVGSIIHPLDDAEVLRILANAFEEDGEG